MSKLHPATFTKALLWPMAELLAGVAPGEVLLDPFAGLGHKLGHVATCLGLRPLGIEIERGYLVDAAPWVILGDATALPLPSGSISAACTSPVYPNGMADNFVARDDSTRHTYVHRLRARHGAGYRLHPNNAAGMQPRGSAAAMARFYALHATAWREVRRVLVPRAPFVVNVKDTPHEPFTERTLDQLAEAGFTVHETLRVPVSGLNHGAGHEAKADHETLILARAA